MNNVEANLLINVKHNFEANTDIIACKVEGSRILILSGICELLVELEKQDTDPARFRTLFLELLNEARKDD